MEYRHYHLARELTRARAPRGRALGEPLAPVHAPPRRCRGRSHSRHRRRSRTAGSPSRPTTAPSALARVLNMAPSRCASSAPDRAAAAPDAILVSSPSLFPSRRLPAGRGGLRRAPGLRGPRHLAADAAGARGPVDRTRWSRSCSASRTTATASPTPSSRSCRRPRGTWSRRGMEPAKFRYLPNGIDLGRRRADRRRRPSAWAIAAATAVFTVGFVGTLGGGQRARDAHRRCAAAGPTTRPRSSSSATARSATSSWRARPACATSPSSAPIPKGEVAGTVALFDACYVGYRRSSLYRFGVSPNKLYDYMAAGRPILFAADAANQPVQRGRLRAHGGAGGSRGAGRRHPLAGRCPCRGARAARRQRARLRRAAPRLRPPCGRAGRDPPG